MARFAVEVLGIELTEGQPDTSAKKANEEKSGTVKKVIAAVGIGAALIAGPLVGAGTAQADNYQDVQFLALLQTHGVQANMLGIPMAHGVCSNIDAYRYSSGLWPATQYAIRQVYNNTDYSMTWELSSWFAASSVVVYCPWNKLNSGSGDFLALRN